MPDEVKQGKFCPFGSGSGSGKFVRCYGSDCAAFDDQARECLYVLAARTIVHGGGTPPGVPPLLGGHQA